MSFSFHKPAHQNLAPGYNFTGRTSLCVRGREGEGRPRRWVTYY